MLEHSQNFQRPHKTIDGNQAASHAAYAYSEYAAIYPITPSSPMAELVDEWAGQKKPNIFGNPLIVSQMQSEAGVAGALHGALLTGTLATTFTSSQGLLLMLPNIYRIAGEFLPGVIHVAARSIATHALSIFGDHSDIYAARQTGAAIFAEGSVQEVMDLSPVAHLSALCGSVPFINFFDGFRTSHELHKVEVWTPQTLAELFDKEAKAALTRFQQRALHPTHARLYGSAQNPDIFFQVREAGNPVYNALPQIVERQFAKINKRLGTNYGLFDYYGSPNATHVIVAMGSVCETIKEYLAAHPTAEYGLISVHLYRPFSAAHFLKVLPATTKQISVLNRTKEPGATAEPLYLDVLSVLQSSQRQNIKVYNGRYGLSSKDTTPDQIAAVYQNESKSNFTIGIEDDVTALSLPIIKIPPTLPKDTISCKFWGLGGDGTVSATKNIVKILGDNSDLHVQGYFEYDSKKSRGLTLSHLRFGKSPIQSTYLIHQADFVACHNPVYLHKYDMVQELKQGGIFLLNCYYKEQDLEAALPTLVKDYIARHNIRLFLIDAMGIGKEIGLNNKISTILQAAFFAASGILPAQECKELMKAAALKSYGKMGDKIIQMNNEAIERGFNELKEVQIPNHWKCDNPSSHKDSPDNPIASDSPLLLSYVKNLQQPITDQKGDSLPVSAFLPYADGFTPPGSTAHERRNTATEIPVWKPEYCIQCNRCAYVCPHAVIRPVTMNKEERDHAPSNMKTLPMQGISDYSFAITVSHVDCTGCGACVGICPGKQNHKALELIPVHEHKEQQIYFDYGKKLQQKEEITEKFKVETVKGSQFVRPLMEFSGACAGCGETPYVRLLTQLFGSRMFIANATGCSSIWANSSPSTAYTINEKGQGPAWSNSLFEDAAEFGFGMLMSQKVKHSKDTVQWVIGGDGWAYDIGFSGLDHILASGENINILVLDTEVYSNTGGQASKATPKGATAKFVSGGKTTGKKDLASIAMTYKNVYVAQIAMGADLNQTIKALSEAAAYDGPSLIIAYSTCIAHGLKSGMGSSMHEEKKAVDSGYFHLFRYNPALKELGKNPFILDSKEPTLSYEEFLAGEIRYGTTKDPSLFKSAEKQAKERYRYLQKLQALYEPDTEV